MLIWRFMQNIAGYSYEYFEMCVVFLKFTFVSFLRTNVRAHHYKGLIPCSGAASMAGLSLLH